MASLPKKLTEALLPIWIVNWIAGLGIFEYPLGKPRPIISFIYVIFLLSGYLVVPIIQGYSECNLSSKPSPAIYLLNALWTYDGFIVILSIIICWYYQEMVKVCITRIELINETLECLGAKDNWGKIFRQGFWKLGMALIGVSIPVITSILWFYNYMSIKKTLWCSFRFHAPILFMTIVDLTFGMIIRCIGYTMESINFLLENAVKRNPKLEGNFEINEKHHKLITLIMSTEFNSATTEKTKNLIQLLKHIHLELSKVTWDINKIYGLQIAMATVANIVLLILDSYYVIKVVFNDKALHNQIFYVSLLSTISSCLVRFGRIAVINYLCGRVAKESVKPKEIIFELNKNNENAELTEEIEQFSLQIGQRPLSFSMCGLFTLEHKFVGSVMSTAVTYLVCLLQIGPEEIIFEPNNTTESFTLTPN